MSSALPHLEEMARRYTVAAVNADRNGNIEVAISNYKKAREVLLKILRLYPDSPFTSVYVEMIREYERRIRELKSQGVALSSQPGQRGNKHSYYYGEDYYDETDIDDFMLTEKPGVTFDDVADLEHAKRAIREAIVYPVKRPDLFPLGWPRGILLFGPPGCGKTMLAAAVASEVEAIFYYVDAASIMSKWLGEAEKNVARLFKKAREHAKRGVPAIIFIDEIDALLGMYSSEVGGEARVRNQFLKEMDGIQDKRFNLHVYVIGATNKPWRLDEPFIRRFQKRIYIPLPNFEARLQLFKMYTKSLLVADDVDFNRLAQLTEGYTASDIKDIIQAAHMKVVREFFELNGENLTGNPRPITMDDLLEAISSRRPSVDPEMIKAYEKWYEKFRAL